MSETVLFIVNVLLVIAGLAAVFMISAGIVRIGTDESIETVQTPKISGNFERVGSGEKDYTNLEFSEHKKVSSKKPSRRRSKH